MEYATRKWVVDLDRRPKPKPLNRVQGHGMLQYPEWNMHVDVLREEKRTGWYVLGGKIAEESPSSDLPYQIGRKGSL